MSLHVVTLEPEDVVAARDPGLPCAVVVQLTLHGMQKLDEARTRHGALAVHVVVQFPSDEFYPRLEEAPE